MTQLGWKEKIGGVGDHFHVGYVRDFHCKRWDHLDLAWLRGRYGVSNPASAHRADQGVDASGCNQWVELHSGHASSRFMTAHLMCMLHMMNLTYCAPDTGRWNPKIEELSRRMVGGESEMERLEQGATLTLDCEADPSKAEGQTATVNALYIPPHFHEEDLRLRKADFHGEGVTYLSTGRDTAAFLKNFAFHERIVSHGYEEKSMPDISFEMYLAYKRIIRMFGDRDLFGDGRLELSPPRSGHTFHAQWVSNRSSKRWQRVVADQVGLGHELWEMMRYVVQIIGFMQAIPEKYRTHVIATDSRAIVMLDGMPSLRCPKRRMQIRQGLISCFPNVQFIVTVRSDLKQEEQEADG